MKQVCGSSKLVIAPPYGGLGQRRTICISSVAPNIKRRWVHTEANELLLAVAPYLPQMADQIIETVDSLPQIAEMVGRDVHSVAETTTGLPQLQAETCASSSSVLMDPSTSDFPPTLEINVDKIKDNLKNSYVGQLNEKEILELTSTIFEFKRKILNELAHLAGEDNGPLLFNTTGADDLLTTTPGNSEYKRSYLLKIWKSLMRKGKSSSYYAEFLKKRVETFPNSWVPRLKIETLPEEIVQTKLLHITQDFLMKDD